jgi:hypothetical protein
MEKSMDNAARARQRILALSLPLTAVLYIGAEGLTPKGLDQVVQTRATAFKVLPIAAAHPAQLYVAGSLALLALGALAVSYAAIAALVRDRGSAVATVAALIGGLGAFCGALVNVLVYPSLAAVATAHLSQDAAARFLVTAFNSGLGMFNGDASKVSFGGLPALGTLTGPLHPRWPAVLASRRSALASAAWGWHTAGCGDRIGTRGRTASPWWQPKIAIPTG